MKSSQPRLSSSLWLIIRHEARILFRDGTLPLVCGVLALMVGWGLFVGLAQASLRDRMIAEVTKHEQEAQQTNRQTLQSVLAGKEALVPFSNPANPAALAGSLSGLMRRSQFAAGYFAVGQSDMMPKCYHITYLSKVQFMYDWRSKIPGTCLVDISISRS